MNSLFFTIYLLCSIHVDKVPSKQFEKQQQCIYDYARCLSENNVFTDYHLAICIKRKENE